MKPNEISDRVGNPNNFLINKIDLISKKNNIEPMRTVRECKHCGREFQSLKEDYCSNDCLQQIS